MGTVYDPPHAIRGRRNSLQNPHIIRGRRNSLYLSFYVTHWYDNVGTVYIYPAIVTHWYDDVGTVYEHPHGKSRVT